MAKKTSIKLFENKKVRSVWDNEQEKWYISIVDVIEVLTESVDPAAYWRKLKQRLKEEGNETVTNCHGLKMQAADGKMRLTDVADVEQLFRLIQSIPSPKAEPFKLWLGKASTTEISKEKQPVTFDENKKVARQGGSVAAAARKKLELESGKKVVSKLNAKSLKSIE
jgi:hypothetical protein